MSSVAGGATDLIADPTAPNRRLKLHWIACGKDDGLFAANRTFAAALATAGVKHEFLETEGNHRWPVWCRYLADFAPRIFKNEER